MYSYATRSKPNAQGQPDAIEKATGTQQAPGASYEEQASALAPVQVKGGEARGDVHGLAQAGTQGAGSQLPHFERIQAAFGHHDVSSVQAYSGGRAAEAARGMGAEAFATGNKVAFGTSPDLHTAAHEAAHVVQQRAGVQLQGGVGKAGDSYEKNADDVADRVVQGRSAQDLLDQVGSSAGAVQQKAVQKKPMKKVVSGNAGKRLQPAADAIAHTKSVFEFGAGNQYDALKDTKFNSNYRLAVMRNFKKYWQYDRSIVALAQKYPAALTAAMADIAKGGNCGEHAIVAFDYLRALGTGDKLSRAAVDGFDHAFVLIGDLSSEGDADIVVSDPWPSVATAVLWEDHFAYAVSSDRKDIKVGDSCTSDGANVKETIKKGIRLNRLGQRVIQMALSEEQTEQKIKEGTEPGPDNKAWIWRHDDAHAQGKEYDYVTKPEDAP